MAARASSRSLHLPDIRYTLSSNFSISLPPATGHVVCARVLRVTLPVQE
jgi:hypothetical protein